MSIRLHQLAKELGKTSKELMAELAKLGVKVKGHMSAIESETADIVRHEFQDKKKKKEDKKEVRKEEKPQEELPKEPKKEIKDTPPLPVVQEKKSLKEIELNLPVSVKQLADGISIKPNDLIKTLMKQGVFITVNQNLQNEMAIKIAEDHGFQIKKAPTLEDELLKEHKREESKEDRKAMRLRAPIVTFMGHVDHGKTSLLDYIRKTKVAAKEKGGITQHIGAYEVNVGEKGRVTFIDTPGHQAFTAMRARGANATDIVVLVIAADDGIMPQTIEAIDHAKAAGVTIVVAINKCDLPNISIDKVKKQLSQHGLMTEEWGGKTITVPVSAKTGEGVDTLLEMLALESEILELKANPDAHAKGVVIEGKLSPGQGAVATLLVRNGTLRVGDVVMTGVLYGRVKAMINDRGKRINEAPPSTPVEILGLSGVPEAGDEFFVVKDEKKAKTLSLLKRENKRLTRIGSMQRMTLEELYQHIKTGTIKELKIIIKTDVQGSLEALRSSVDELSTSEVKINVAHVGVGNVNESDVMLALVLNAIIIGFHVKVEPKADELAKKEGVDIKSYGIIYEAIEDIRAALEGLLEPIEKEIFLGRAQVRQVFRIPKIGAVAGSYVSKGLIQRGAKVKLIRNKEVVYKGKIRTLKHVKDDIKEAREGFECGISLENQNDIRTGDLIESFSIERITRRLGSK